MPGFLVSTDAELNALADAGDRFNEQPEPIYVRTQNADIQTSVKYTLERDSDFPLGNGSDFATWAKELRESQPARLAAATVNLIEIANQVLWDAEDAGNRRLVRKIERVITLLFDACDDLEEVQEELPHRA